MTGERISFSLQSLSKVEMIGIYAEKLDGGWPIYANVSVIDSNDGT